MISNQIVKSSRSYVQEAKEDPENLLLKIRYFKFIHSIFCYISFVLRLISLFSKLAIYNRLTRFTSKKFFFKMYSHHLCELQIHANFFLEKHQKTLCEHLMTLILITTVKIKLRTIKFSSLKKYYARISNAKILLCVCVFLFFFYSFFQYAE